MKNPHPRLAVITTCFLVLLFYGCASRPDATTRGDSSEAKPQSPASPASQASPEERMRQVLRGYKIGVTTHKKCMSDATAGSWQITLGGMGLEVPSGDLTSLGTMGMEGLSGKVTLGITVGIGERKVCDLVFEGKDPQTLGTGKTPNFDKFLLKQITFKP